MPRAVPGELTLSLAKTLRRCHSTVRADRNKWAPICGLVCPSRVSPAMDVCCAVSVSGARAVRLRAVSPVGQQLAPGPFGKCPGTHSGQHLVRGPQLDAGVRPAALWLSDTLAAACLHVQRWSCTEPRRLMETLPPLAPGAVRWRRRWRGRQWRRSPKLARLGQLVLAERSGRPPRPTSWPGRSLNWRGDTLRLARSAKEGAVGGE